MAEFSRRSFVLSLAAATAGVALAALGAWRRRTCPECGIRTKGHRFAYRGRTGVYCPNCAVDLDRGALNIAPVKGYGRPVVPFPHPALVQGPTKPVAVLANTRLFRS